MSLAESYHAAHKERLARLSPPPKPKPVPVRPAPASLAVDAGWDSMWFYDLVSVRPYPSNQISVRDIQSAVAEHYGITVKNILSHRRTWNFVLPRHVAMYLTSKLTLRSSAEIGRMFGRRDHSTVLHAKRKISALAETDSTLFASIAQIRRRFP